MKILHTSDWHIGQLLVDVRRDDEHRAFFDWLLKIIESERIEAIIVAGDVFDNGMPGNHALEMYYSFLAGAGDRGCRQIIITGGNHDSPSTLHAPRAILSRLHVTVVGAVDTERPEACLVTLTSPDGTPRALVCAVPYLRDRDVYTAKPGELDETRAHGIVTGIAAWYRRMADLALARRTELKCETLPILAVGHLFAQGGKVSEQERPIYVGNLGAFSADYFPGEFDYVALGHLHRPQLVQARENIRYSGSPIPLAFDEADQQKQVLVINTENPRQPQSVAIPLFRRLVTIEGDLPRVQDELRQIGDQSRQKMKENSQAMAPLVKVVYTGAALMPDLAEKIAATAEGLPIRCFSQNASPARTAEVGLSVDEIKALTPREVFERLLDEQSVQEDDRAKLLPVFDAIVEEVVRGGAQ